MAQETTCIPKPVDPIKVLYTNWRGEQAVRIIIPREVFWGATEWHKGQQWLLRVWDCDRQAERVYALKDIEKWFVE